MRQLAAILFTDMQGYTALMARDEALARRLRDRHREVLRDCHVHYGGEIVQYFGDGTLSLFSSAVEAVRCAADIQRALQKKPKVPLRIGLHFGEVVRDEEGLYGHAVNIASRLESLATPGAVLISARLREELSNQPDLQFRSLGFFELKNVPRPMEVFALSGEGVVVPNPEELDGKGVRLQGSVTAVLPRRDSFVGREKELKLLYKAWNEAHTGKGIIIGIAGEPGIGKTSLVEDFLLEVKEGGKPCTIARGRCSERLAGSEAYLPFLEMLDDLMREEENAALLKQLAPSWYVQLRPYSVEESKTLELATQATQERRKRELAGFLEQISKRNALLIFMDDLHWMDDSSVDLLAYLSPRFTRLPLLLVLTYRPVDMKQVDHPFLEQKPEWQAKRLYREIDLSFLSVENITDYLELEYPGNLFPREFAVTTWKRTEGNPLFMTDLVRHLREKEVICRIEDRWQLIQPLSVLESELPDSIKGMIERKIQRLSKEDRKLLQIASVQGYEFDTAVLATLLSIDSWQVEERLESLSEERRLTKQLRIDELPDGTLNLRYKFVHALYQNALFHSLTPGKRIYLCGQVAETLLLHHGEKTGEIAAEVATLFQEARNGEQAVRFFLLATQRAALKYAYKETVALGEKGLDILRSLPGNPENQKREMEFLLATGPAKGMVYGWGREEVIADHERCYHLSRTLDDTDSLFPVYYGLMINYSFRGNLPKAEEISREALEVALEKNNMEFLPYAYLQYGCVLEWMGEVSKTFFYFQKCLSHYDPSIHMPLIFKYVMDAREGALGHSGWDKGVTGFPDQGLADARAALEWAEQLEHPSSMCEAYTFLGWVYNHRREFSASERQARLLLQLAEEHGFPFRVMVAKCLLGRALVDKGQIEEGLSEMRHGLGVVRSLGTRFLMTNHLGLLAEACLLAGRQEEGLETVEEGLAIGKETGEVLYDEELYRLKGELLLLKAGNQVAAEKCFRKSIDLARERQTRWWELLATVSLARLWRKQGKTEEAYYQLKTVYDWFTEGFDTVDLKEAKALLEQLKTKIDESNKPPSIAVLPFINLSPDPEQEYFCDGLSDEVITDLSGLKCLLVISRNSSAQLKGTDLSTREISRKLGIGYLLTGSVRRAGNRLRITAQLVDASEDRQIWADKFSGTVEDVFDLQEKISRQIVAALNLRLSKKEEHLLSDRPIEDIRAFEAYLQAHREIMLLSEDSLDRARQLIDNALEMIGPNSLLLATKGHIQLRYIMLGIRPDRSHLEEADRCLQELKLLNPDSLDRYLLRGMIRFKQSKIQQAANDFKQALQYDPNNRDALFFLAVMYILAGRGRAAEPVLKKLLEVDPLNPVNHAMPGYQKASLGDFHGAVPHYRKGLQMDPENPFLIFMFGWMASRVLPPEETSPVLMKLEPFVPFHTFGRHGRFLRLALEGKKEEALAAGANDQLRQEAQWDEHSSWWMAGVYSILDEKEQAMDWLENAVRLGYFNYPLLAETDPFLENLRDEKRFQQLMMQVKRKWKEFKI